MSRAKWDFTIKRVKTNGRGERTETREIAKLPFGSVGKMDIINIIEKDADSLNIPVKLHINILLGIVGEMATQKKFNWKKARYTWYSELTPPLSDDK